MLPSAGPGPRNGMRVVPSAATRMENRIMQREAVGPDLTGSADVEHDTNSNTHSQCRPADGPNRPRPSGMQPLAPNAIGVVQQTVEGAAGASDHVRGIM